MSRTESSVALPPGPRQPAKSDCNTRPQLYKGERQGIFAKKMGSFQLDPVPWEKTSPYSTLPGQASHRWGKLPRLPQTELSTKRKPLSGFAKPNIRSACLLVCLIYPTFTSSLHLRHPQSRRLLESPKSSLAYLLWLETVLNTHSSLAEPRGRPVCAHWATDCLYP